MLNSYLRIALPSCDDRPNGVEVSFVVETDEKCSVNNSILTELLSQDQLLGFTVLVMGHGRQAHSSTACMTTMMTTVMLTCRFDQGDRARTILGTHRRTLHVRLLDDHFTLRTAIF